MNKNEKDIKKLIKISKENSDKNIITFQKNIELQSKVWEKWKNLNDFEKQMSEELAYKLYGMSNENISNLFLNYHNNKTFINNSLVIDKAGNIQTLSDDIEEKLKQASINSGIPIIYKQDSLIKQLELWKNWLILNDQFKNLSNQISLKISNLSNREHHSALMLFWKKEIGKEKLDNLVGESTNETTLYSKYKICKLTDNIEYSMSGSININYTIFNLDKAKILIQQNLIRETGNFFTYLKKSYKNIDKILWEDIINDENIMESSNIFNSLINMEDKLKKINLEVYCYFEENLKIFKFENYIAITSVDEFEIDNFILNNKDKLEIINENDYNLVFKSLSVPKNNFKQIEKYFLEDNNTIYKESFTFIAK